MKHDELCPIKGSAFLSIGCQCKLIAKVRTDQQKRVDHAIDDALEELLAEYDRGVSEGYRIGREAAANDVAELLEQFNLPQMINVEYVIRYGYPRGINEHS